MAHVLLPCDLPSWIEVQKLLQQMQNCRGGDKAAQIMAQVHETSSVSLDPDDSGPILGHPGFERLKTFLSEEKWTGKVLSDIAEWASKLPSLRPLNGVHYSLRNEERSFCLDRSLVVSLLANAFLSTFPRRKEKTHPTLQDFTMANFFTYLDRESHQKKLRAFLRYFEALEPDPDGTIQFIRKLFRGPSLPGWLCSERPLAPLVIRPQGCIDEAEPWVFRGCSCSSSVGGNVLSESTAQESELFFEFPELLTCLCFLENLVEEEALIVEGVRAPNTQEVNFCFLDTMGSQELDDHSLLKYLNKAVAAFTHEPRFVDRRRTPDGEESSEGQLSFENMERIIASVPERFNYEECTKKLSQKRHMDKSLSQASSKDTQKKSVTAMSLSNNCWSVRFKIRFSMRTASESSARLEEEYYTADEDSESESAQTHSKSSDMNLPPDYPQPPSSSAASLRSFGFVLAHSEDEDDEMNLNLTQHERLEDFRRRIRRRTRRKLSSRRSSSYSSGTNSSDMEDISEDPEDNVRPVVTIRPACSEPSLVALSDTETDIPPWISPEAFLSVSGQKQLAATCSGGHLKSYSHDGVRPNLPVPFRARFRVKKRMSDDSYSSDKSRSISCIGDKEWLPSRCPVAVSANEDEEDSQLKVLVLWLAASMAQLPALILYTMNEPALKEVMQVYNQVLNRQWTIGDLACEVLRFCRNQTMPGHRAGKHAHLFGQLMANKNGQEQPTQSKKLFTEESLD